MKSEYKVDGMTCMSCVATVKKALESIDDVSEAEVTLHPGRAVISSASELSLVSLRQVLGLYEIEHLHIPEKALEPLPEIKLSTYKPLLLIVGFIAGTSILSQYPTNDFDYSLLMRHFMAGFFIVFSFFKLLNIEGFASSYSMYDVIAKRWTSWGYIYPFVELGLGILYLINVYPTLTNYLTIIILVISSIGVIQSNLRNDQIKCACLGDVFNLPMSSVTIIEDVSMILMAGLMLLL